MYYGYRVLVFPDEKVTESVATNNRLLVQVTLLCLHLKMVNMINFMSFLLQYRKELKGAYWLI